MAADTRTDRELDRLIAEEEKEREDAFARIVENGGLPTNADVTAVYDRLGEVYSELEQIESKAKAMRNPSVGDAYPFTISHENIAAFALIATVAREESRNLRELADAISDHLVDVEWGRRAQQKGLEAEAGER